MKKSEIEDLVIELILNTRKKTRRALGLIEISNKIEILRKEFGSLSLVARKIGISNEMVREFWRVRTLPEEVKEAIKKRKIDLVDTAYRLSLLNDSKRQIDLAKKIIEKELPSKDVREIVAILRLNPRISVNKAILKYKETKDIIRYKFIFPMKRLPKNLHEIDKQKLSQYIQKKIEQKLGFNSLIECSIYMDLIMLVFTDDGFYYLKNRAREVEITKKELILRLVSS